MTRLDSPQMEVTVFSLEKVTRMGPNPGKRLEEPGSFKGQKKHLYIHGNPSYPPPPKATPPEIRPY